MSNNKIIYWIGNDFDEKNKNKQKLRNYFGIKEYDNVINAMNDIKKLEFEFVFVIINCDLFENFVSTYTKDFAKTNRVIVASIIFCDNIYDHLNKKFINDQFYNPGGITDNIGGIINYINYAQNSYYNEIPKDEVYINLTQLHSNGYGELQCQIVSEEKELIIPIIWNKIVTLKINGINLSQMQKNFIYNYSYYKNYIYPTREKIFKLSEQLLAKYFLYFYTVESPFYKDMNRILSYDEGFDIYREYITTMYMSLKNKTFETYTKTKLYRGTKMSKNDFEKLYQLYKNKKEGENLFFFTKSFLSFTKDESITDTFLGFEPNKVKCKYIIQISNTQFAYNIDVKDNSYFKSEEEEVLFLPMSCFFIVNIKKTENRQKETVYNIYLKYIDECDVELIKSNDLFEDASNIIEFSFLNQFNSFCEKLGSENRKYLNYYIKFDEYLNNSLVIIKDFEKYVKSELPSIPDITMKYINFLGISNHPNTIKRIKHFQRAANYSLLFSRIEEFISIYYQGKKYNKIDTKKTKPILDFILTFLFLLVYKNSASLALIMNIKPLILINLHFKTLKLFNYIYIINIVKFYF